MTGLEREGVNQRTIREKLDTWGDFNFVTEGQFNQIVSILQKIYKNKPETIFTTAKNLILRKTTLKELSRGYDEFEKDARRVNIITRINDEEGTYHVLSCVKDACENARDFSEALKTIDENITNYHKIFRPKSKDCTNLKRLGELAVRVCMEQKQNYW